MEHIVKVLLIYLLIECILRNVEASNSTVWGKYPGVVSITGGPQNATSCVGHIVNSRHVVTIAECTVEPETNAIRDVFWYRIFAGDIRLYEPTQYRAERNVINIFVHKQYNPITSENNIAILRIDREFPYPHNTIESVILNSRIVQTNAVCDFVGWKVDDQELSEQQSTTLLVYDRDFCNSQQYPGKIYETMICGQLQVADNLLSENFGGGLYCNEQLTGILTTPQTATSIPSIFTQIRFYRKWIREQITKPDWLQPRRFPGLQKNRL